ncbi:hypothetical protein BGZ94_003263 [Podila epigama]|nr:hypothetical protein BGZ94_003263 [Podila epigama]
MSKQNRRSKVTTLSLGLALALTLLSSSSSTTFVSAQQQQQQQGTGDSTAPLRLYQDKERVVQSEADFATFDSNDYASPELAATAVSPFCKSFTFLCHVRCLQRGDGRKTVDGTRAPNGASEAAGSGEEINRCIHVPDTKTNRVLCLCNNGVDLTAEVDYALEGVVDITAAGGDGTGTGEAGKIREVVYGATKTVTVTVVAGAQPTAALDGGAAVPVAQQQQPPPEAELPSEEDDDEDEFSDNENVVTALTIGGDEDYDDEDFDDEDYDDADYDDAYYDDEDNDDEDYDGEDADNEENDDADYDDDIDADAADGGELLWDVDEYDNLVLDPTKYSADQLAALGVLRAEAFQYRPENRGGMFPHFVSSKSKQTPKKTTKDDKKTKSGKSKKDKEKEEK